MKINGYEIEPGANLRRADLHGADLTGADLRGADLRGAILYGADLERADLGGADLRGADLYKADLSYANLRGADLYMAILYGADLHWAKGVICLGHDPRGYRFVGIAHADGWRILAGCRWFTLAEAQAHWTAKGNKDALARIAILEAHPL